MGEEIQNIVEEVGKLTDTAKTCFMCEHRKAEFCIKDKPKDRYCRHCAEESFGDVGYLQKM